MIKPVHITLRILAIVGRMLVQMVAAPIDAAGQILGIVVYEALRPWGTQLARLEAELARHAEPQNPGPARLSNQTRALSAESRSAGPALNPPYAGRPCPFCGEVGCQEWIMRHHAAHTPLPWSTPPFEIGGCFVCGRSNCHDAHWTPPEAA